ncbi:MAG TPA: class I SAM-dependent methyltransferase [Anaerolineales bacterium]|nr:class I SAM-dependent methyltransferase [Anaerolineales bacterium]
MRLFYNTTYRYFRAPWDSGPREELVRLVESGRLKPGRVIDLGSGTASNCIFLAQHGFDVTGVDFAAAAVALGEQRARQAGVEVRFLQDDLTHLRHISGTYDLLIDYGTLDDLSPRDRDLYVRNVLPLTHPGSQFLLYGFEWHLAWWERAVIRLGFFGAMALEPGEAERRFAEYFDIERVAEGRNEGGWPRGYAVYLMRRKG